MTEEQKKVLNSIDPETLKALMSNPEFVKQCVSIAAAQEGAIPPSKSDSKKSKKKDKKKKDKKKKDKKKKTKKTMIGIVGVAAAGGLVYGGAKYYKKHHHDNEGILNDFVY